MTTRALLWIALLTFPTGTIADKRLDELRSHGEFPLALAMAGIVSERPSHNCQVPEKVEILGQTDRGWIYISLLCDDGTDYMIQSMSETERPFVFKCKYWNENLASGGNPKCWQKMTEPQASVTP